MKINVICVIIFCGEEKRMNIQSIITTNAMACVILTILFISSHIARQRRSLTDRLFTLAMILNAMACIIETVSFIIDGKTFLGARPLAFALDSVLYADNILLSFTWCLYVDYRLYGDIKRIRKNYRVLGIVIFLTVLSLIPNIKYQFYFSIGANNVYHRTMLSYLFYLITLVNFGISVVVRYGHKKKFGNTGFFPIWMFLAPMLAGTLLQVFIYGISTAWCSVSIGLVGMHLCLQNELSYIDPLTKAYNRNYLNQIMDSLERKGTDMGGIMIDLDDFKSINDVYGHSTGDDALIDAARVMRLALPDTAMLMRFAGDEFIILIKTGDSEEIEDCVRNIRSSLREFNETSGRKYKLSFSIGTSIFRSGMTSDSFLKEMDSNMYIEKNQKHYERHPSVRTVNG